MVVVVVVAVAVAAAANLIAPVRRAAPWRQQVAAEDARNWRQGLVLRLLLGTRLSYICLNLSARALYRLACRNRVTSTRADSIISIRNPFATIARTVVSGRISATESAAAGRLAVIINTLPVPIENKLDCHYLCAATE